MRNSGVNKNATNIRVTVVLAITRDFFMEENAVIFLKPEIDKSLMCLRSNRH